MSSARTLFAAALMLVGATAAAEDNLGRTPAPNPPRGKGEHCVADTGFMRRNHMLMMFDHRKEVLHEGVRAPQYSLSACVSCHAVKGDDGQPVSYASDKHFCRSCHSYAAVSIDCFECHNSKPETAKQAAAALDPDTEKLAAFLRETKP